MIFQCVSCWRAEEDHSYEPLCLDCYHQQRAAAVPVYSTTFGPAFDPALDYDRIIGQMQRVRDVMLDGRWHSLREIADATGDPEASVSAQLRHLRKPRFGSHVISKRRRTVGTWEYLLGDYEEEGRMA